MRANRWKNTFRNSLNTSLSEKEKYRIESFFEIIISEQSGSQLSSPVPINTGSRGAEGALFKNK